MKSFKINKFIFAIAFSLLTVVAVHPSESSSVFDLNGNGTVEFTDVYNENDAFLHNNCPKGKVCDINNQPGVGIGDVIKFVNLTKTYLPRYDINGNGMIDPGDVVVLRKVAELGLDCPVNKICDIDGDGKVTADKLGGPISNPNSDVALLEALVSEYHSFYDLNNDGRINNNDVVFLIRNLNNPPPVIDQNTRPDHIKLYDINNDGEVNLKDVVSLEILANEQFNPILY